MKTFQRFLVYAVIALTLPGGNLAGQTQELTLAEAVRRAMARNPELAVDEPGLEAARAEIDASRAAYFPRIDFEQSLTGGDNPVYVFGTLLTQRRFSEANFGIPSLNTPDAVKNLQSRITGQQTLWDFGRTRQRVESARVGLEMTDHTREEHVNQVLLGVVDAYYSVSLARSALETARAAVASADSLVAQAQSRVASGLAVEADLLRSQVHQASARQQEIEAAGRLEMARAALNRIMGESLEAPQGSTAALAPVTLPLPSEESLLAGQRQRRPDYQRLLAEVHQTELDAGARKSEFLPVLGAFASLEVDNPSVTRYGGSNWTAGLSLRWNVFAGGGDSAALQAARHRLEQKRRQLSALESALALELRQALIQVRSAAQQLETMRAAEEQSREGLRILRNRYDAGLATMTDLLSAETARAASGTALAEAIYRYRISFARLEFAAGTLSPTSTAMSQ
jgi:outer membrane protein